MSFYKTNAIYNEIAKRNIENYYWVSENAWILIYGDARSEPKLIILAFNEYWIIDQKIVKLAEEIASKAHLPMMKIKFCSSAKEINSVDISKFGSPFETVSLIDLKNIFSGFGLPVSDSVLNKAINSAESSAYHSWQRESLGGNIVVADIDLVKVRSNGEIVILELKRSFYSLDRWSPYPEDYPNFFLLDKLSKLSCSQFFIVYNQRTTKPIFFDDPSRVSVFAFEGDKPRKVGEYMFDQLFN
ncbi:hypothetical protein ACK31D_15370 [Aeromonas caviae]